MANSYLETLRAAVSFAERAKNVEIQGALNKAVLEASELISDNAELRDANQQLREQIKTLEHKLAFSETLEFIHGLYHAPDAEGRVGEPFCPTCWEATKAAVHLHWERRMGGYICNHCNKRFEYTNRNPVLTRGHIDEGHKTPNSEWNPNIKTADGNPAQSP